MSVKLKHLTEVPNKGDSLFDALVERIGELVESRRRDDAIRLIDEHPEHAERLHQLLPAIEALASFDAATSVVPESPDPATAFSPPPSPGEGPGEGAGLLGDFRIVREIGRGGMGVVYEAQQISLNRRVALKVLPLAAMLDARRLERFRHEAQAAAMLRHPHIVTVYSVGCERGVHYYAMDYIEGPSLAEVAEKFSAHPAPSPRQGGLGRGGDAGTQATISPPLTPPHQGEENRPFDADTQPIAALSTLRTTQPREFFRAVARLGIQAAEALDYAHQMGVVHRDIKPSNLLIDSAGDCPLLRRAPSVADGRRSKMGRSPSPRQEGNHPTLWITDFGLAMTQSDAGLTMTGDLLGTLRYMSPEQAAGKRLPLDHRTDIYSLGITLYELLAGRPAFDTTDRAQLLRAIAESDPPPLRKLIPTVPLDLETIVHKAIEKDAADRYATSQEFADDLRRFLEDRAIVAQAPSLAHRARKWTRRHTSLVAFTTAALVLAVAGLTTSTLLINRQARRAEENLNLSLAALEDTLAESVAGELIVEARQPKREELRRRGIAFYEQFARNNGVDPQQWPTYRMLLCNERHDAAIALTKSGQRLAAEKAFNEAIAQAMQLSNQFGGDPRHQARLANCLGNYAILLAATNRFDQAVDQTVAAERLALALVEKHGESADYQNVLGKILYNRGKLYEDAGQPHEAEETYRAALAPLKQAASHEPSTSFYRYMLAQCHYNLGRLLGTTGQRDEARRVLEHALGDWQALAREYPRESEYLSRAGATLSNLAVLARDREDFPHCRNLAEQALDAQKRALALNPPYEFCRQFLQGHYKILSQALWKLQDDATLAAISEERITLLPDVPWEYFAAAGSLGLCAEMLEVSADDDGKHKIDQLCDRSLAILADATKRFTSAEARVLFADAYLSVGDSFQKANRPKRAVKAWNVARDKFATFADNDVPLSATKINERIRSADERLRKDARATDSKH